METASILVLKLFFLNIASSFWLLQRSKNDKFAVFGDISALFKLKQKVFFCFNRNILLTLAILKEKLGTLWWRLLLQQTTATTIISFNCFILPLWPVWKQCVDTHYCILPDFIKKLPFRKKIFVLKKYIIKFICMYIKSRIFLQEIKREKQDKLFA